MKKPIGVARLPSERLCRNGDARDLLNCSEEPTFPNRGSCNSCSASSFERTPAFVVLAEHLPHAESLCSEVEQNDHLCSVVSAFPFTKDPARFATMRWVLEKNDEILCSFLRSGSDWQLKCRLPSEVEKADQEQEVWSAIRYLDPDEKDNQQDRAAKATVITVLALLVIVCGWALFYFRGL